ncbi:hypothetical protein BUALT_Bualt01G0074800 [Buddleja alternifolia]|uniref:Pentatricopeptide repeat-containing protein n=1 Tax=Buddleja alternifolia TaxID=168488 RepID=A0AAV6Y6A5_9LAMI|nr:hypothetical protein BUALT_Bualt01G0074800 [Buddleja alternifolia]
MASTRKTEIVTVLTDAMKNASNYELEISLSNRFEYNAAAEVVKEVHFEEVEDSSKREYCASIRILFNPNLWPIRNNLSVENVLIDMYAKCGCLQEARKVFDEMQIRDVVLWTSMMSAYGRSGKGHEAIELFSKMQELGLVPDSIAFVSILSACSHAGLLNEGKYYYKLMREEYKIIPRLEHFTCMVDLLGRAGRVNEAYDHIKRMPNERVWGALLSACNVYNNMDIGVIAVDHLFQLAPEQSGYYVLLSNIYAKAGRWKDVTLIRLFMKGRGIKKIPGVSNVELDDRVHTFLAGDRSHPRTAEIYDELDILLGKMKEAGYVPNTTKKY